MKNISEAVTILVTILISHLAFASGDHIQSDKIGGYFTQEGHYRSDGRGCFFTPDGKHMQSDGMGGWYR